MARRRWSAVVALVLVALLPLSGCGGAAAQWRAPTASATPSAGPTPTPTAAPPTPSPDQLILSVDGIGPYKIGVSTVASLQADGLITSADPYYPDVCSQIFTALGTREWTGRFTLYFKADLLVAIVTAAPEIKSVSGAQVGMTTARIEQIYGSRVVASDGYGGARIYTVTVQGRRLVMQTGPDAQNIREMFAQQGDEPPLTPHDGPAC